MSSGTARDYANSLVLERKYSIMPYDQFGNYVPYQPQPNYGRQIQQNVYAFVNGLEGAKSYQVPANQTVLLMDSEQPVCYMKSANALGQGTLRYFRLTEVTENDIRGMSAPKPQPNADYVTKADFESIIKRIEKLEAPKGE